MKPTFFERDVETVARGLLGKHLKRGRVVLRITEVEAYGGEEDSASHCRFGRTARNAPMWGEPGRAYVYLCYGIHQMLNIVAEPRGSGAAVLIRACELVAGESVVRSRRGTKPRLGWLAGPGKVGQALGLDTSWSGHRLFEAGGLSLLDTEPPERIRRGPRVGIDFASPRDRARSLRFALDDTRSVTHEKSLLSRRVRL